MADKDTAPSFADTDAAHKLDDFVRAIPNSADDDAILFGRAPKETHITVGMLREFGDAMHRAIHAFVKDLPRSAPYEHVVKHAWDRMITIGDLKDFAQDNPLPASKEAKK